MNTPIEDEQITELHIKHARGKAWAITTQSGTIWVIDWTNPEQISTLRIPAPTSVNTLARWDSWRRNVHKIFPVSADFGSLEGPFMDHAVMLKVSDGFMVVSEPDSITGKAVTSASTPVVLIEEIGDATDLTAYLANMKSAPDEVDYELDKLWADDI